MQVVNQLIKHDKNFDLLVIPGAEPHRRAAPYGDHKRWDFFVQHLLGVTPPSWAAVEEALKPQVKSTLRDQRQMIGCGGGSRVRHDLARADSIVKNQSA